MARTFVAIGRVDTDPQHLDQHAAPVGHLVQSRHRQIGEVNAVFLTGTNGDGLHGGVAL